MVETEVEFYVEKDMGEYLEEVEVKAYVVGEAHRADYGVPGSPTWTDVENARVWDVWVDCERVDVDEFFAEFGDKMKSAILDMAYREDNWK